MGALPAVLSFALAATATGQQGPDAAGQDPLTSASIEFGRLRDAATGAPIRSEPGSLHVDRVQELFRRAEAFGFSGGFLFARGGKVVAGRGCGLADRASGTAIGTDTVFDIGSVAKQFTAAAILRLEEMGRLRVEDGIARHLPDVPADKEPITIHHLMTHSSGLPPDVGDPRSLPSREDAVRQVLAAELRSPPGTKYEYSNAGYVLLAAIVERASKEDFDSFLRSELWSPLGMNRTGMRLDHSALPVAWGYTFTGPCGGHPPEVRGDDGPSWLLRGCGYVESTLEDLHLWTDALRAGRVLSAASREKLFRPYVSENAAEVSYYAYGWAVAAAPDGMCMVTHDGSAMIHHDFVTFLPAHDAVLIAFNTQRSTPWRDFLEQVTPVLLGAAEIDLPLVASASSESVESYAGEYRLEAGASLHLIVQGGRLTVPASNAEALRLFSPWPPATGPEVEALGDRAVLVTSAMDSIARGEYEPLLSRLPPGVRRSDEAAFWNEYWPRWIGEMGPYHGADLIETVRVKDSLRSLALIRFERSSLVVGFVHSEGGSFFVDTMSRQFVRDITLAPSGESEFTAFHPSTRRSVTVTFSGPADARMLTVRAGGATVVAQRVASH